MTQIVRNQVVTDKYAVYHGDCVEVMPHIPSESIGLSVFSPPFAELYTYSDELADMGNSKDYQEFFTAFRFLVKELYRVMMQGRNVCVHCMDLPIQKGKEGYIGLRDFSNMIRESFEAEGFIYHSRVTIWKDPVVEMQRTKALGLLHKQVKKDATMSRVGLPDYIMVFRKDGERLHPVTCDIPVETWQKYASPVWYDINYSNTLNLKGSREERDEKHICLAQGSLVLTQRGYIPIEDVSVGDKTLTHTGSWKAITAKEKTGENREVVQIHAHGVPYLQTTPSHRIWARKGTVYKWHSYKIGDNPGWIEAKEMDGNFVNLKLPPEMQSEISAKEWWIIGRWLADGHVDSRGHQFFISVGKAKMGSFKENMDGHIGAINDNTEFCNTYQIGIINLSDKARLVLKKCGNGALNKVLPVEAISLNRELSKELLDGYISGDGHIDKGGRVHLSSVSRSLLLGMAMVVQRALGIPMAVYAGKKPGIKEIQGRLVNCKQLWVGIFCNKGGYTHAKMLDDGAWKRVKRIEQKPNADVWNITVDDDHSYTAEGCIVKNCPLQLPTIDRLITLYSNKGDTVLTPFAGIGSEVYQSVLRGRMGIGIELKESYYNVAVKNCRNANTMSNTKLLFE